MDVAIPDECEWTATSNVPWIAITGGGDGAGPGTIAYSVAANPSATSRTGTFDVAFETFTVTQAGAPCTATLSPASQSVSEGGGTGSLSVTLPDGCAWTATSGVSWIAITGDGSGTGSGTIAYSVAANADSRRRSGTLEVAGQAFTVTQAGAPCTATLSPASASFSPNGGTGAVSVSLPDGCVWQASSSGFVTVTSVATGIGSGTVSYAVAANATGNSRTQTITIAGQSFVVSQSADSASPSCTGTLSPTSQTFSSTGGSGDVTVSIQDACGWTAVANAAFITISSGASGSGSGFVRYSLAPNTSGDSRVGTMTIAGRTFTVTQTGSCTGLAVSPSNETFGDGGGTGTVAVTAPGGCAWQATAFGDFVTITAGSSGIGAGTVSYRVAANTTGMTRQQIINVGGQQVLITQNASGVPTCNATLSPSSASVGEGEATGSLAVTIPAGCAWTATSRDSFLSITSGSSSVGSGTVGYRVSANTTGSSRSGTLTVAQQVFTVTQSGVSCRATLSPSSATVSESGGSGSISVTIAAGCSWTASSDASWASIGGSSGTGPGTVTYSVPANSTGSTRNAVLTIAQQRFELTQSGPSCGNASISPTSASFSGAGGSGSVSVSIPSGCAWQASAGGFVTITSGSSGVGPGTVTYSVESNTTGSSRNHSITIAGRSFMVSQSVADAPNCRATLSPSSASVTGSATSGSVSVSIPSGCSWTASSNASFITVTGGSSGTGSGSVSYSVSELTPGTSGYPSRSGTITIAQQTFSLTQTAPTCGSSSVSISPESASFTGAGGSGSVSVTIPAGCAWQAFGGSFVTITSGSSGTGPGTVSYRVEPNLTGSSRNHSIAIAGRPFMVSQSTDGAPNCRATLSPSSASVTGSATSGSVSVSIPSGCSWTASSNASFLTVTGGSSGTGSGSVSYSVAELTSSTPGYPSRSGTITIAQQSFTVTQTAPTCGSSSVSISPTSASFTAAGGTGTVSVTIPAGCAWQAFGGNFVTITSGANSVGPGTVTYSVAPNTTGGSRNHSIAVAGHPFMVSQAAN